MNQIKEKRGPISWMARNTVAANLLMILFLVGGLVSSCNITQEFFPDILQDTVTVRVPYPGASPEEVEQGIVRAVEEAMRSLEGVKEVTSVSSEGSGRVTAEILDSADPMKVYQDIKSEVDRIRTIPEDAEEPVVTLDQRRRMVVSMVLWGKTTEKSLRALAENVRERLLRHPSITQVELNGIRPLEIAIEVPQENLRRYGLTLQNIAERLRASSIELPGGSIKTESGEILVRVKERRDWGREFAETPVISTPDGSEILLGDIAEVIDGFEDTDYSARFNSMPAVRIEVYRVGKQTPVAVHQAVESVLEEIRPDMPEGTHAKIRMSFADIYRQRAGLLLKNGAMGLCLVMLLLGSFLELRLAFWVMMGIPVSFLGTLLFMPSVDLSLNMMTMFAFILSLGIVVDDAIVVGENIYHYHQQGYSFIDAAIKGTREVCIPIAFSILTNIVAFIPMLFLVGMMGKFLWMLPAVVIIAFTISWIECLFILPAHIGHQKERGSIGFIGRIHKQQQKFSHGFSKWVRTRYAPFLDGVLRYRYIVVALAVAILAVTVGYLKSGRMGFSMFTTVESDYAYASIVLPFGSPAEKTTAVANHLEQAAYQTARKLGHPDMLEGIFAEIGKDGTHTASIRAYLPDARTREKLKISTQYFVDEWRKEVGSLPGVTLIRMMADRGGPGSGPALTVELQHEKINVLEKAAVEAAEWLEEFPLVKDTDAGFQKGKTQFDFVVTPAGKSVGLTARGVARQLRNAYWGSEVLRQQRGRDEIKIRVRLPETERVSVFDLQGMILRTPAGGEVPLMEAVSFKRNNAYTVINRRNGKRTMTITADVRPKSKADQVRASLNRDIMPELMNRYPGLSYSYEGREADRRESFSSLAVSIPLALFAIYALLAIPFRSYIQPLIVMVSIPFGIVGAILGHLIMGYELTMIGIIGVVALSGVVVNDSLILIDFANRRRKEHNSVHDAVVSAGIQRFRPILLTTLTTFFGLMPMIFETSRQARFLIPMAISLGYGLLFATMITLILVPSLYMIIEDVKNLFRVELI
ncbi:efflux RND transporter permease subunit [Verrucomicrobiota bacterium]